MTKSSILIAAFCCALGLTDGAQFSPRIPESSIIPLSNPKQRGVTTYWLITEPVTFAEADEICRDAGFDLLSIESVQEQNTVQAQLVSQNARNYYWTSGNDLLQEGSFVWKSTLKKMFYQNFASPSGQNEYNDCVSINGDAAWNYRWMVNPCSTRFGFICEIN